MSDTNPVQEGQPAPDFTLEAEGNSPAITNGKVHLADLQGKNIVLYFYPKDD